MGSGGQTTLDDISRCHELPYEIKIVDIGLVFGAGGFLQGLPIDNVQRRIVFSFSFEIWRVVWGMRLLITCHKISHEIKLIEIRRMFGAGELSKGFTILIQIYRFQQFHHNGVSKVL
ncbi:hypothetical protein AVEN_165121-1 [Araneus ventricosus]|uniref:Uncharacterized protein n=1 Tax=Araneus ventricosus TaxID=182803 RepID=A0A4Y2BMT8_ARAVE|nr:hypothetical protein AVEN_165121-1 [Araneus ventricosus]